MLECLNFSTSFFTFIVKNFRSTEKLQEQNNELSCTLFVDSQINILPHFFLSLFTYHILILYAKHLRIMCKYHNHSPLNAIAYISKEQRNSFT